MKKHIIQSYPPEGQKAYLFNGLIGLRNGGDAASRPDGAEPLRVCAGIMMPMCKPVLTAITVFTFMGCWNDLNGPLIYLYDSQKFTLSLGLSFFKGLYVNRWDLLMAATFLVMLPVLIIFFFAQDYTLNGISISNGAKGRM